MNTKTADALKRERGFRELRRQGLAYAAIAKQFGISRQRVHQITSRYTIMLSSVPYHKRGMYHKLKTALLQRYGGKCSQCWGDGKLVIHHLDGDDTNNFLENLIPVCRTCHQRIHKPGRSMKTISSEKVERFVAILSERIRCAMLFGRNGNISQTKRQGWGKGEE